jgi:hypothetical protein
MLVSRGWSVLSLVAVVEDDAELRLPHNTSHTYDVPFSLK